MESFIIVMITALVVSALGGAIIVIFSGLPLKQQPHDNDHNEST